MPTASPAFARRTAGLTLSCVAGDITRQADCDAVVNAANAELLPGGGVAGAIHRAAGPELAQECAALAPIAPGDAVITQAYGLPNRFVIHALGPRYGIDRPEAELLAACYRNALTLADTHELRALAVPALSTGAFGYPMAEAAPVAMAATVAMAPMLAWLREVRFVLADDAAAGLFGQALDALLPATR